MKHQTNQKKKIRTTAGTATIQPKTTSQTLSPGIKSPGIGRGRNPLIRRRPKMEIDITTFDQPGTSSAPITRPDILSREAWERIMSKTYDHNGSINLSDLLENLDTEEGGRK